MIGNIKKVRFKSTCPFSHCRNPNIYYWTHSNCGGDLYLDNRAMLTCDRGDAEDYIFNWRFDIGFRGESEAGFEKGCYPDFFACLSSLATLNNPPVNFIAEVTKILLQHKDEFNEIQ